MHIRNTIYKLQFFFSIIILAVFFLFYNSYKESYEKDLGTYIKKEIEFNKSQIKNSLHIVSSKYKEKKDIFENIHKESLVILKGNENINLNQLKENLSNKYKLKNTEIQFYIINSEYVIYNTTYPKDLGFNLSVITEAKMYLDKTKVDGKIYLADNISEDALDGKYKLYSYSKFKENNFLELGFIDKNLFNSIWDDLSKNKNLTLYRVNSNENYQYFYEMKKRESPLTKENHFNKLTKFEKNKKTDNLIINTINENKETKIINEGIVTVYLPLLEYKKFTLLRYTDIVMKLDIDVSEKINELNKFQTMFILLLIFILLFLFFMFNWIKVNFTKPIEKMANSIKYGNKIEFLNKSDNECELSYISNQYNNLLDSLNKEIKRNRDLTYIDDLTKMYNRKAFNEKISDYISLYNRYKNEFCLIHFDIDDFKKINDTYGHNIGDKVLIDLSKMLHKIIRVSDTIYRVGGEEFVIILPQTKTDKAKIVAEKIRNEIEQNLKTIKDKSITVSMGLTKVKTDDTEQSIYKRVDDLMYQSKIKGKNKVTYK